MKNNGILILLFLFLVSSCRKKELPADIPEDPLFFVNCTVNNEPLLLEAGNEGYYMNASFYRDTGNLYVLKADLNRDCGLPCGYALTVLINDYTTSLEGNPVKIDSALYPGFYSYNNKNAAAIISKTVLSPDEPENTGNTYTWIIRDGTGPELSFTLYQLSIDLSIGKTYTVSLFTEDNSGCYTEHMEVLRAGGALQGNVAATRLSASEMKYAFTTDIADAYDLRYEWEFGDGAVSSERNPVHTFPPKAGYYTTRLTVFNSSGDTTVIHYQIAGTPDETCLANFSASFYPLPNLQAYSKVVVLLTKPDGTVFSTQGFPQPETSKFRISQISDYIPNNQNDPTKMVRLFFNCLVRNDTEEISLNNGEAILAFAYR